jgi:spermidine/putrescine transport system ATP-binding protein
MVDDLECRDVVKAFGAFTAVDRVDLNVPQGKFFSILGPSGCGKTTLMRMIAGFTQPTSGDILIKGKSVLATPPNKRPVNMVFQHLALFPMMTVAENIGYGLRRRGMKREEIARRVDEVLARVGLPDAGPKQISQLSGGQKQRVAIARCVVLDPAVLLLDEPLGALDLKLREHMKIELKQLQHQFGTTFVYITHDQSEALVMSDQVAVMNAGRFEQVAAPRDLYYKPATAFVAGFVGDSHRWRGRVVAAEVAKLGFGHADLVIAVPNVWIDVETVDDLDAAAASFRKAHGHRLRIATEGGVELAAVNGTAGNGAASLVPGTAVEVFVRPEAIAIGTSGGPETNALPGTLESLLFNGANSRAMVRLDSGGLVGVAIPQTEDLGIAEGAPVTISFAARNALCFAAAEADS